MTTHNNPFRLGLIALAVALGAATAAQAQSGTSGAAAGGGGYDMNRSSWIPYTTNGYIGLNLGRSDFKSGCGVLGQPCDRKDTMGHVYLGGYFKPNVGAEIGYFDMGDATRGGGRTSVEGINISLVGRVPLTQSFSLYGKLGPTYGRTRVSSTAGSGIGAGSENGWGVGYALGVSWDMSRSWSTVLEWQRQSVPFPVGRGTVDATSLGIRYNF